MVIQVLLHRKRGSPEVLAQADFNRSLLSFFVYFRVFRGDDAACFLWR